MSGKVSAIVTDNAHNIIWAVDVLHWQHQPCVGHTLHLAVNVCLSLESLSAYCSMPQACQSLQTHLCSSHTAVSAESKQAADHNLILTPTEITQLEQMVGVLEPFEEATTVVSAEKNISISVVLPVLTAPFKKHLKPSEVDTVMIADVKNAIFAKIKEPFLIHGSSQKCLMELATVLEEQIQKS